MLEKEISRLVEYGVQKQWIAPEDRIWASNRILEAMEMTGFEGLVDPGELPPIQEILNPLCDYAYNHGVIEGNSAAYYDIFDTKLMGLIMPRPSEVIQSFDTLYKENPKKATDWYYELSGDSNYIRRDRIRKDVHWTVETEYGTIDISINLSKPEKDPKAIAAAAKVKSAGYPKCLLCAENEGYAGHLSHPARQNHRIIPLKLNGMDYFLQYSPYVYYNEHCIVFNQEHTPMRIDAQAFANLLDFVTMFPHYMLGSNADLPIVGGSVLSHDHYQGGNYTFAMAKAPIETPITIPGYEDIEAGIVKWPMSVIRIKGKNRERLVQLADHILATWRGYDDPAAFIYHETDGELHSTITPIARRRGDDYELDLVLRNNITTEECPLGVFHPHSEKHHIKKENIGLIEVMGLAILPARLREEMDALAEALTTGKDMTPDPKTASHAEWAADVATRHPELNPENVKDILKTEIGAVFCGVLEDAGVYKRTEKGKAAFLRFVSAL
jgi:UDPglucose--hexose-1-phosphate uridylyltransferase